jgi:Leucine-rich repeat (LRR) protein
MRHGNLSRVKYLVSKEKRIQSDDNQTYACNVDHFRDELNARRETQVGAFAVAGIQSGMNDVEQMSLSHRSLSMVQSNKDLAAIQITSARLVADDVVNAVPIEMTRCKVISTVSFIVLTGIIILIVILTRRSSNDPDTELAATALLEKLEPLLTHASRDELKIPDSVPSLAFSWLEKSNFRDFPFTRQVQRFAMAAFFFSTNGRLWKQNTGWLTDSDECTWYQSSNESACVNGTLRMLSLRDNNLYGLLPNDVALFSSLDILDLSSNGLAGSIPMGIKNVSSLIVLNLGSNKLVGMIPTEVGFLRKLNELSIAANAISGEMPSAIGYCTELTAIYLGMGKLNGTIPSEIGALTKLQALYIDNNPLTGTIPSEIGRLTTLTALGVFGMNLDGSIPSEIGRLTKLEYLGFHGSGLVGTIPSEIGALTELNYLAIDRNSLNGTFPENLCYQEATIHVDSTIECSCCT